MEINMNENFVETAFILHDYHYFFLFTASFKIITMESLSLLLQQRRNLSLASYTD